MCISGIALVLGLYSNRRVPTRWPLGITLNAYISVLSAVAKYAMAVPIDEALGQLRWLYFASASGTRKLIDFERFDDATRGPWGALVLLVYTRARFVWFTVWVLSMLIKIQNTCITWCFYYTIVSGSGPILSATSRIPPATQ
jgi:hypothetical protein